MRTDLGDDMVQEAALHTPGNELAQRVAVAQVACRSIPPGVQKALLTDGSRAPVCTQAPLSQRHFPSMIAMFTEVSTHM